MKRPNCSDSLGALMSICPNSTVDVDENNQENNNPIMYTRDFQTMLQGLDEEESGQLVSEKKRRLSVDQVRALEKNFEVENKLEPERKVKLAQELGLQPRQVAVWFQNRRARWKTKQLERDYGLLRASHDALNHKFETLQKENGSLLNEIRELKSKLNIEDDNRKICVKEEPMLAFDSDEEKTKLEEIPLNPVAKTRDDDDESGFEPNLESSNIGGPNTNKEVVIGAFYDLKDGSSDDSDSSAILNNEDNINSPRDHQFLDTNFKLSESKAIGDDGENNDRGIHHQLQYVKIEEPNFLDEESCTSLFSDDQAPTLHWYCSDEWN